MKKGYWNGEHTAEFTCVLYEVKRSSNPNHWQNMFVGQVRQAVKITYAGETWYIDNEHGDGYYKVTTGQGSPRCGHKSIDDPIIKEELPEDKWVTEYDAIGLESERFEHDDFIRLHDPETFEKLKALRESAEQFRKQRMN